MSPVPIHASRRMDGSAARMLCASRLAHLAGPRRGRHHDPMPQRKTNPNKTTRIATKDAPAREGERITKAMECLRRAASVGRRTL